MVSRNLSWPAGTGLARKRIDISTLMAAEMLGIKGVDNVVWLVSLMHYGLGSSDLEQKTLQTIDNPFSARLSPVS